MARNHDDSAVLPADFIRPIITLRQLFAMVWAYRVWIGAFCLACILGTAIYSKVAPKTYQATSTLLLAFQVDDPLSGKEFSAMLAQSYMATQIEFIKSPPTLLGAVDKLHLADNPDYMRGYFGDNSPETRREWAMHSLAVKVNVDKGRDSRFIYVSVEDHDPVMAAKLANTIAESYVQEQARQMIDPAKERAERYGEQLEALKTKVDEAQQAATDFRSKAGLISLGDSSDVDNERLMDLDRRLSEARARRQAADLRLQGAGEGDASVLGSTLVQNLKNQLTQKEAEMAELQHSLGSRHPQYLALKAEIDHMREQLNHEIAVYGQGARAEAEAARSMESKLEHDLTEQRRKSLGDRAMQEEGARLVRELETATKVYQSALDNYDKILMGAQLPQNNASIVTQATPPVRHIRPMAKKNVAIATGLSLFLGIGFSLMLNLFNRKVRCREDLERDLGIPVLAELVASKA